MRRARPRSGNGSPTPSREVWNTYGPTEATVVACGARLSTDGPVRIGLPLDGWDLAVVDGDGLPVTPGEVGELIIGGVGLARYLDPAKDAEKYAAVPSLGWSRAYRSGDLVRFDGDGLVFLGRADDQVKLGGRRIELGEMDSALLRLPGVLGAAAAVRTTACGQRACWSATSTVDATFDLGRGRRRAPALPARRAGPPAGRGRRPPHAHLGQGRPRRAAVAAARRAGATSAAPGPHRHRRWIAELWLEVIGADVRSTSDDFFDLGGGSLTAAQIVSRLRATLPRDDGRRPLREPDPGRPGRHPGPDGGTRRPHHAAGPAHTDQDPDRAARVHASRSGPSPACGG